jgi:type IV secretion system protein VirD4
VQIYMTPQDDRTAEVLSNALGRSTITALTESQSRVRALEDSANVSRRSEERPLISANEVLRFPLDEVLVLPEGQYPIRAQHVRYYEDRWFEPIDRARRESAQQAIWRPEDPSGQVALGLLSGFAAPASLTNLTEINKAVQTFQAIAQSATSRRKLPDRV